MNENEGVYICGYCKKRTAISDEDLATIITPGRAINEFKSFCDCGHFSYASTIRFKAQVNTKDWRPIYGSIS